MSEKKIPEPPITEIESVDGVHPLKPVECPVCGNESPLHGKKAIQSFDEWGFRINREDYDSLHLYVYEDELYWYHHSESDPQEDRDR